MAVFYGTKISPHITSLTDGGYLLCSSVPIARTGSQFYLPSEIECEGKEGLRRQDGLIEVFREPEDGRIRHSHKGMADVIVFWDDAPAPEDLFPMRTKGGRPYRNTLGHYHCGCCPNCRCTPMPLVFVEDLKFPVRVYTNGKIIRMNQKDFDRLYREKSGKLGKSLPNLSEEKPKVSLVSDEMTSEELSRKAKEQKRDDKGQFSKEGNTGQKNQEERKEPEEQKEDIFYIDQLKEIENCKALYSVDEMQEFEDKKKKRTNERIQYDKYWCEANLEDTVKQFLPNAIREPVNKNGKIYYLNDSNIIIDYDVFGDYFRIFDKTKKIKQAYLMIDGNSLKSKKDILKANPHVTSDKAFIDKFLSDSHYKRI